MTRLTILPALASNGFVIFLFLFASLVFIRPAPSQTAHSSPPYSAPINSDRQTLIDAIKEFLVHIDKTISELEVTTKEYPGDETADALLNDARLKRKELTKTLETLQHQAPPLTPK